MSPYDHPVSELMVWADVETTGLKDDDALLEIAVRITDSDLRTVGDPHSIVIHQDEATLDRMPQAVWEMHTVNGLIDESRASTITEEQCQELILYYITEHIPEARTAPLCGSSVHFDRRFIAKYLPRFHDHLSYRNVDVSTIKELVKRWHPAVDAATETGWLRLHRAEPDILNSITLLENYRRRFFS